MKIAEITQLDILMSGAHFVHWLGQVPRWIEAEPLMPFIDLVNKYYCGLWLGNNTKGVVNPATGDYQYPGDPLLRPIGKIERFGADGNVFETIFAYPHELWGLVRADFPFEISRLD